MKPHAHGHFFEDSAVMAFFGDRTSSPESLKQAFHALPFVYLNQTHSDIVLMSNRDAVMSGDAHVTTERRIALCIRTADCLPVLIHDPEVNAVAAIHAGWRGVENEIVRKACAQLRSLGSSLDRARAWIGPHIGPKSFEVGKDVADRLLATFTKVRGFSPTAEIILPHNDAQKAFVDLLSIARTQLRSEGIGDECQNVLAIDTFSSSQHASFRRDAGVAGRQVSFIVLK